MRLSDSRTTTLDANGNGTVRFGPVPWSRRWRIELLTVRTSSTRRTASVVYLNSVSDATRRDSSPFDGNDATSDTVFRLEGAETLIVTWTGGNAGSTATATIEGEET